MSDKSPKVIPPFAAQPANSGGRVNDSDWMCPDVVCGNINFARRNTCNRCGKERVDLKSKKKLGTEIGKSAADKSRGLFSADDWQCNKCANVNWARRQTCNVCNAPKFGEVEARTGYGGGYNERGTVEYRPKRDSDDDEYDEFGRRKKRKLKDSSSSQAEKVTAGRVRSLSSGSRQPARSIIMENRVSSTNEIKYRFTGKTIDENFEVTYTLEERIRAAAWAIAYQNCKVSSEKFQNTFDKPAPDFKTIFAWRQRLLYSGCLVDKHVIAAESPKSRESQVKIQAPKRFKRRKRVRYFRNVPARDTTESSSSIEDDNRSRKLVRRSLPIIKNHKVVVVDSESREEIPSKQPVIDEQLVESDTESSDSDVKDTSVKRLEQDANTYASSSNATKQNNDDTKQSDEYFTDNVRSITPELTSVRSELAHFPKSPVRVALAETQFQEDIYFEDDIPPAAKRPCYEKKTTNSEVSFLVPQIPKDKNIPTAVDESLKNILEDIVSESERYSSDGAASETDFMEKVYGKDKVKLPSDSAPPKPGLDVTDAIPKYQPSNTTKPEVIDLPLPKFGHQKVNILSIETGTHANTKIQSCTKNMSLAMRRIYESMSTNCKDADTIDDPIEYIPTKIDPAMAKRNHQLFKNDLIVDTVHNAFTESKTPTPKDSGLPSPVKEVTPKKSDIFDIIKKVDTPPKKPVFKIEMFEDYLPEEDALYRDTSSDGGMSDETRLKTPPAAPNIGSLITETAQEPEKVTEHITENMTTITKVICEPQAATQVEEVMAIETNPLSSILNFNFSSINAEDLALALKNIQNLTCASTIHSPDTPKAQPEDVETVVSTNEKEEVVQCGEIDKKKNDDIPFLGDMFDPGSPLKEDDKEKAPENEPGNFPDLSKVPDQPLDELLDLPTNKPIIGSFKSFAFAPKPIMLNRLRKINQQKATDCEKSLEKGPDDSKVTKKGAKSKKRPKPGVDGESGPLTEGKAGEAEEEEEDEESGEEGDLSKYDLWGSEAEQEEPQEKGQSKSPKAANNNPTAEKINDNQKEKSKSPPSKNNDDKRKSSESGSASSRSSSSSSSSSDSSSGKTPRNRYDDFNLNSEHSPPSPPGRVKERGGRSDRNRERGRGSQAASRHHHRPAAHKVDSGRRHRTHRHRR